MGPIFSIALLLFSVIFGFIGMGGDISVLWQPYEILIIVGAAVAIMIGSNSVRVLKDTLSALSELFTGKKVREEDFLDLLGLLYSVLRNVRSHGMLQLEAAIEKPYESELFQQYPRVLANKWAVSFLCDYLRLLSLGTAKPHELEALMDEEIRILSKDQHKPAHVLGVTADSLPALGIIAAVLGVIRAMGSINQPPEVLGHLIGGALFGTFFGILLSYGVFNPLAGIIRSKADTKICYFVAIKATLLAHLNGAAPQVAIEYGRKVLHGDERPTFDAVERATILDNNDAIRHAKNRKAA